MDDSLWLKPELLFYRPIDLRIRLDGVGVVGQPDKGVLVGPAIEHLVKLLKLGRVEVLKLGRALLSQVPRPVRNVDKSTTQFVVHLLKTPPFLESLSVAAKAFHLRWDGRVPCHCGSGNQGCVLNHLVAHLPRVHRDHDPVVGKAWVLMLNDGSHALWASCQSLQSDSCHIGAGGAGDDRAGFTKGLRLPGLQVSTSGK